MLQGKRTSRIFSVLATTDWALLVLVAAITGVGLAVLYSISRSATENYAYKQAFWLLIGLASAIFLAYRDYNRLRSVVPLLYVANIVLLLAIVMVGHSALGAQRWISVAGLRFQPSEFAKIAIIITLAAQLSNTDEGLGSWRGITFALLHVAPAFLLILIQPDLGTSLVMVAIVGGILVAGGARPRHLLVLFVVGVVLVALVLNFHLLKDYQVKRLVVFINPEVDPLGSGYNLQQSMIAVGSGQLRGKGLFSGTQSRLSFLPIRHTDFIFAVLGEELGFLGAAAMVLMFVAMVSRGYYLASAARSDFGLLLGAGIASMWLFQVIVNIGMTIGIMPVTGIPLPFVSYGGSAALANMMAFGLLLSLGIHRFSSVEGVR